MYDLIIIGAGPAGLTAALYAGRADLKTLVLGIVTNSNAHKAHLIENYLGIESISGPDYMMRCLEHAKKFGAEYLEREVLDIKHNGEQDFTIVDSERDAYKARAVLIASGLGFKPSGIKNEQPLIGRGVSFCVTCDGAFFKGKNLAVIGSSNYAADEALQLLTYTPHITILSHGKKFEISPKLEKVLKEREIACVETQKISKFLGEEKLSAVEYADGEMQEFDGIFMALGHATAADFATKLGIERTGPQKAYIVSNPLNGKTNVPGVYAAGDCTGGNAQASKSSGEGCNAAIQIIKDLKGIAAFVDYS
ncbi:thioredoxin reductase [Candidatus Peregrinibacteria bacterium CG11_big_fil_rev_8_21_14_0_20_46_8]|nr:MAG: thioredoxin reductase [Candidatus Peregrinibacteria bacterium CG11_big_fil_rev_8_21_14_0_20_46_8]